MFEIKICVDNNGMSSETPENGPETPDNAPETNGASAQPAMTFEAATKRFKELLGMGTAASMGLTIAQRQEELKNILAFLSGEEPEGQEND